MAGDGAGVRHRGRRSGAVLGALSLHRRRRRPTRDAVRHVRRGAHPRGVDAHRRGGGHDLAYLPVRLRVFRRRRVDRVERLRAGRGVRHGARSAEVGAMTAPVARPPVWAVAAAAMLASGCPRFHSGPLPGEPADATFAEVDGVRVRYVDVGQGPAVVLIHGFGSSLDIWDGVIDALRADHRVLALDLKGFGWSSRPPGDYSPAAQARLVLALANARGIDRFSVVGHSWGASVALALALAAPDRVDRVALYSAWVYEEQLPSLFLWARAPVLGEALFSLVYRERIADRVAYAYYDPESVPQARVDAVEELFRRPGTTAAALAAVRGQRYARLQRHYKDVRQPVLLIWGREDRVARLPFGERLAGDLPNARLVVVPRCGHIPMREAAAATTRALVAFLAGGES
ncbi:MAG: alpha/beta fold hydrolase [Deltaproteobacteria bacterium]|nr:MAG: alpha/beta fold hydrolase [Deltaproteobacteria bacterium]